MTIKVYDGNLLFDSKVDVICHQVNCQGVMGAGIAKQIRREYPRVFEQYKLFCEGKRLQGKSPLGSCQLVYTDEGKTRIVANLFGQEHYGRGKQQTDYAALERALTSLANNKFLCENSFSLGFPWMFGCALGGGEWKIVLPMVADALARYPGNVEIWKI